MLIIIDVTILLMQSAEIYIIKSYNNFIFDLMQSYINTMGSISTTFEICLIARKSLFCFSVFTVPIFHLSLVANYDVGKL